MLSEELQTHALYLEILQWNRNAMLPIAEHESAVSFGRILDFSLFQICKQENGQLLFCARKRFLKEKKQNTEEIPFCEEHRERIFRAINAIYADVLRAEEDGTLAEEAERAEQEPCTEDITRVLQQITDAVTARLMRTEAPPFEDGEILLRCGEEAMCLFEEILTSIAKANPSFARKLTVYRAYIHSDSISLQTVAEPYGLSRERIRQIKERAESRLHSMLRRSVKSPSRALGDRMLRLAGLLEEIDFDVLSLLTRGMPTVGKRKRQAFLLLLFGKETAEELLSRTLDAEPRSPRRIPDTEPKNDWVLYPGKICYPSEIRAPHATPVPSVSPTLTYRYERRLKERLERIRDVVGITVHPDLVYCTTMHTEHRPQLLLQMQDGTSVLVVILPTLNMAYIYNVNRCNSLHLYCREHGYGYLVTNERGVTIYDLKRRNMDPAAQDALLHVLNEHGKITEEDLRRLRPLHRITDADIAAFVLQNRLRFTPTPYVITRR